MAMLGSDKGLGKAAICLAGGGVEGLLFEVGVLKALNAHLQSRSVTDFDIFCGISAGSMIAAFLANGTEPEEMAAATTGNGETSLDPVTPRIMLDPHLREYFGRMFKLGRQLPMRSWEGIVSTLLKTVPPGFFRGEVLKEFVAKQLSEQGRTDDFRTLAKELYIGATDQDTSAHVVFGAGGQWQDVPISTAVRASCALTPYFEPEKIRGRYFVDGQYTRTSNFHIAVQKGATLVVVVNPLVPIKVDQPGYVRGKGGVFSGLQALKAVIHTRFMHAIRHGVENNPDVDFVLFTPQNEDMRLMSGSPMKYNVRTEIINAAYRFTVRKIQRDFEILSGTFAKHNFRLQRHPRLRTRHLEVY
jgi:predicted acylesterase/phospholipase RssA